MCVPRVRVPFVVLALALIPLIAERASSADAVDGSGEWITFVSHRSGHNLLYRMRPDGSEMASFFGGVIRDVPVIHEGVVLHREPHWTRLSPNREYFASWVYEKGEPYSLWRGPARPMLVVGDLAGTWTRVVNPDCHEEFAWSPDGKRLAFSVFAGTGERGNLPTSLRSAQIVTCGIDGSNEKVAIEQPGILMVLDWSPDGKRLLLSRRYFDIKPKRSSDLFELELATGKCLAHLVGGSREINVTDARYSPRGDAIAVIYTDPENQYAPNECADDELGKSRMMRLLGKLAVMDRDGDNMRTIADDSYGIRGPMCWSPDGASILVSKYLPRGDDREQMAKAAEHGLAIWAVRVDGKGERFLTTGWSPDWR